MELPNSGRWMTYRVEIPDHAYRVNRQSFAMSGLSAILKKSIEADLIDSLDF